MSKKNLQRLSQIITTFGPGSMLDLPTRSVLIGGLDRWQMRDKTFRPINEPRLATMIERRLKETGRLAETATLSLRTPPIASDDPNQFPGEVGATIFPTWFVCDPEPGASTESAGGPRRRRLVRWSELNPGGGRRKFETEDGKKIDVTPIRFVAGCEKGHLEDVSWRWIVHGENPCRETMWLEERGTSADPRDTKVVCNCGAALSLEQLFQPGRLGSCHGDRPWLGDRDPKGCDNNLKLLTRSATNTYFPQVAAVISLPAGEDILTKLIISHINDLKEAGSSSDIASARKFNQALKASLDGYDDSEVFSRLRLILDQSQQQASLSPKVAEFEVFAGGQSTIGENAPDSLLYAETLARAMWDAGGEPHCAGIRSVVAVHRLREVCCLYGFTRFEAAPTQNDGELEDVGLAVDGAPISRDADWLPAIEQYGEGVFIHFDDDIIEEWTGRPAVKDRWAKLAEGHARWTSLRGRTVPGGRGVVYTMLHSLSHALMTEIALDCGYPSSALKERVYAEANPKQPGQIDRCGILIYTATTGSQGTLGGLVAVATRISSVLKSAMERISLCSNDPVCADHEPASSADDRALHGAACHGCILIAETSCESRNLLLDRTLLTATMAGDGAGFF
jgi:hypothetical protein